MTLYFRSRVHAPYRACRTVACSFPVQAVRELSSTQAAYEAALQAQGTSNVAATKGKQ